MQIRRRYSSPLLPGQVSARLGKVDCSFVQRERNFTQTDLFKIIVACLFMAVLGLRCYVYLFMAVLGLRCYVDLSPAVASGDYSLLVECGLLTVAASLVAKHEL